MEKFQDMNDVAAALATAIAHCAKLEADPVVIRFRKAEAAAARHRVRVEIAGDTFEVWEACNGGERRLHTASTVDALADWFNENYAEEV